MTAASNEVVAVIQADRDMAASLRQHMCGATPGGRPLPSVEAIIAGKWADRETVQAFARHRVAHSDPRPIAEGLREGGRAAKALFEHEMTCRGVTALWDDLDADEQAGWQESVDVVLSASRPAGDRPEALTPSADTKAAYIGEFGFNIIDRDEDGEEVARRVLVPWDTIKEIMAAIAARAATHSPAPMAGEADKPLRIDWNKHDLAEAYDLIEGVRRKAGQSAESPLDTSLRAALDAVEAADCEWNGLTKPAAAHPSTQEG